MADETGPGPGCDAQGPREDRLFLVASAWSTRPLFRPRRPARRHALNRQSAPERRWAEQRDGARTPRHFTNPRGLADRRRRTEWDGPARRRRPVFALRRADPLPTHLGRFPRGRRATLLVLGARRPVRTPRHEGAPAPARGARGLPGDPRGHRGRHPANDPDVPRGDVLDDGRGDAPRGVLARIPCPPG